MRKPLLTTIAGVMTMLTAGAQEMPKQNTLDYQPGGRELRLTVPAGSLTLRAVSPAVVEVKFTPPGIADKYRSVTIVESRPVTTTLADKAGELWFSTGQLTAAVEKATGRVRFLDSKGTELLAEMADGRKFTPAQVGGEASWTPQQSFASPEDESLYGLGQHQDGRLDWRGETLRLWQANTEISIPFLWSTKGYGLLWDNPSDTWFNPGETVPLQNKHGVIRVAEAGDYSLYLNHTEGAGCWDGENTILVSGKPLISILNKWVPYGTGAMMKLEANRDYPVELRGQGGLELILHKKTPVTTWRSKVGEAVDYYVIQGDTPAQIIANYRAVSGHAPMMPKYAWGYWQCRERYGSSKELIEAVQGFRRRGIPVDIIVQDWMYWDKYGWNALKWDERHYPDVPLLTKTLHELNARLVVSVWSKFDPQTEVRQELAKMGGMVGNSEWLDPTNPEARKIYWAHSKKGHLDQGVDGFWQDATEPESNCLLGAKLHLGSGDRYLNSYPLFINQGVYEGQRADTQDRQRVCILTRSGYAGQQRYGTACWSGDIKGSWEAYQRQIPAGLGFCSAGMPYWTTDIGGFFRPGSPFGPPGSQYTSPDYHELLCRWLQCGTFYPIQRMHGYVSHTEPWHYGPETEAVLTKYLKLRYQFLPYLYSQAWQIHQGGTLMRPLAMDFPKDPSVRQIADQFMCGDALLVAPIMTPRVQAVAGEETIIPASCLFDQERKAGGLSATYFNGIKFDREVMKRQDATVNFNWTAQPPTDKLKHDFYSVRWEGFVKTENAGPHKFSVTGNDGFRLWVNGKVVCEDWHARPTAIKSGEIALPANTLVPIKLEYFQDTTDAEIALRWAPPAKAIQAPEMTATIPLAADNAKPVVAGTGAPAFNSNDPSIRKVVLPTAAKWYEFWSGKPVGNGIVTVSAPIDIIPLFVRAGSILPFGPELQHAGEKTVQPTELRIYPGANASFELYDDAGEGYGYEKGEYAIIPLQWDEARQTLSIGQRQGTYPGLEATRKFKVILIGAGASRDIIYDGTAQKVKLP